MRTSYENDLCRVCGNSGNVTWNCSCSAPTCNECCKCVGDDDFSMFQDHHVQDDNAREYSAAWMDSGAGSPLAQHATTGTANRDEYRDALTRSVLPYITTELERFYASWVTWCEDTTTLQDSEYYADVYVCDCCALWINNRDESSCRDYYGHDHARCADHIVNAGSEVAYTVGFFSTYCAGCGQTMLTGADMYSATMRVITADANN